MATGLNLNQSLATPHMRDLLDLVKREILLKTNCHAIAKISSYNSGNGTVNASVAYEMVFQTQDQATGKYSTTTRPYPTLVDLPVYILGGGPVYADMPIAAGDECMVLFNDRDLMNWWTGNPPGQPATGRLHSFSDGVALVGLRNVTRAISADGTRGGWTDGNAFVGVNPQSSLVTIKNQIAGSLGILMQQLAVSVCIPGAPIAPDLQSMFEELLE